MKRVLFILWFVTLLFSCSQNANKLTKEIQKVTNREKILDVVNGIFINTDERNWENVAALFSDSVLLDYTSMAGGKPATLTSQQIVDSWKAILPGFEATHHQIGNYIVNINGNEGNVFCYGTASHYLPNDKGEDVWQVVGSYDFHLTNTGEKWLVDKMKFNFKYQSGNTNLPALAQEKVRSQ